MQIPMHLYWCSLYEYTLLSDVCLKLPLLSIVNFFFFLMIRRPPRSTLDRSSAASDVYKRQKHHRYDITSIGCFAKEQNHILDHLGGVGIKLSGICLLYTSPSPRDRTRSRMPSSAWKKKNTYPTRSITYVSHTYIILYENTTHSTWRL